MGILLSWSNLAEAEAVRKHDPDRGALAAEDFELNGWIIERTCPHRAI